MYYIQWRRVGRGMCYNRDGWAEVLCKVETGGPRYCKVETAGSMYYIQYHLYHAALLPGSRDHASYTSPTPLFL